MEIFYPPTKTQPEYRPQGSIIGNFYALKHEEGRLLKDDNGNMQQEYFIKDHLGNIRVRFEDADQDGEIQYEFPVDNEYEESELIAFHHYYTRRDFGDSVVEPVG